MVSFIVTRQSVYFGIRRSSVLGDLFSRMRIASVRYTSLDKIWWKITAFGDDVLPWISNISCCDCSLFHWVEKVFDHWWNDWIFLFLLKIRTWKYLGYLSIYNGKAVAKNLNLSLVILKIVLSFKNRFGSWLTVFLLYPVFAFMAEEIDLNKWTVYDVINRKLWWPLQEDLMILCKEVRSYTISRKIIT